MSSRTVKAKISQWRWAIALAVLLGVIALCWPAKAEDSIPVWVRTTGDHSLDLYPDSGPIYVLNLKRLKTESAQLFDLQYNRKHHYQGIKFKNIIDRIHLPNGVDTALLHHANGMRVPVPLGREMPSIFIATKLWVNKTIGWSNQFPPVIRKDKVYPERRPTIFIENKVVVEEGAHPSVPKAAQTTFSPWTHTDTLIGIELVNAKAYYDQFDVPGDKKVKAGFKVFRQSCQFCHAARSIGAHFGWDFVSPIPIYTYRKSPNSLLYHVRYRSQDAPKMGLKMPALEFVDQAQAEALWHWLRAAATQPLPPYRSPR